MKRIYSTLIAIVVCVAFAPLPAFADTWGDQIDDSTWFGLLPGFAFTAVYDNETGLIWEQSPDSGTQNWNNAQIHCNQRSVSNRKGWRLPTVQELASLVDPTQSNPALPIGHPFNFVLAANYWTATTNAEFAFYAWDLRFTGGGILPDARKTLSDYVWCVRAGQGVNFQ